MRTPEEEGVLRADPAMAQDLKDYEKTVREAAAAGQLLLAIEVARDGLRRFPDSALLSQQLALALAQTGALDAAKAVLADLLRESPRDEETRALLGRVYKELWRRTADPAAAAEALKTATKWYREAFELKWSYYPGINLAFTLLAAGEREKAREVAAKVAKACRAEIESGGAAGNGWLLATLGEALTHLGQIDEAARYYKQAAEAFRGRWRDLASMQRQAREIIRLLKAPAPKPEGLLGRSVRKLLLRQKDPDQAWLEASFEFPSVAVFAGHMIDAPGRAQPRFPAGQEQPVRAAIARKLEELRAGIGYSSAASGADIIFCECLLERGGRLNLVLPTTVDAFRRQSVIPAGGDWEKRFQAVLSGAQSVLFANASEQMPTNDPATAPALAYSSLIVTGLAAMEAQALDLELHAIAVWDGAPGDGPGGTSSVVAEWSRRKLDTHVIPPLDPGSPRRLAAAAGEAAAGRKIPEAAPRHDIRQEIRTVVYAETLNYRKITESQMAAYVRTFRGGVAKLAAASPMPPEISEAWNGEHLFVFEDVEDAALFAMAFREFVAKTPWADHGLPADLGFKAVLHAGPVFLFEEPSTGRPACVGSHAMRAQRIRSITPPGEIYASQEFAALCSVEGVLTVRLEFLGRVPTTKLFEDAPLYRVDRL